MLAPGCDLAHILSVTCIPGHSDKAPAKPRAFRLPGGSLQLCIRRRTIRGLCWLPSAGITRFSAGL